MTIARIMVATSGLTALAACGGGAATNNGANASANINKGPAVGTQLNGASDIPPVDTSGADIEPVDNAAVAPPSNAVDTGASGNVATGNNIGVEGAAGNKQ